MLLTTGSDITDMNLPESEDVVDEDSPERDLSSEGSIAESLLEGVEEESGEIISLSSLFRSSLFRSSLFRSALLFHPLSSSFYLTLSSLLYYPIFSLTSLLSLLLPPSLPSLTPFSLLPLSSLTPFSLLPLFSLLPQKLFPRN